MKELLYFLIVVGELIFVGYIFYWLLRKTKKLIKLMEEKEDGKKVR